LQREWPGYRKPMDRTALARRLDIDAVPRAAGVEPCLADLLRRIGLVTERNARAKPESFC